jgi:hypothetical protein
MTVAETVSNVATVAEEVVTTAHSVAPLAEKAMKAFALWPGLGSLAIAEQAIEWADGYYSEAMSALEALVIKGAAGGTPTGATITQAGSQLSAHINPALPNAAVLNGSLTSGAKT